MSLPRSILAVLLLAAMTACRSPDPSPPSPSDKAISLKDQQLLDIVQAEQRLDARAAEPGVDFSEVQRLFRQVDQMYAGFISRNPEDLDSRLLYGKLLSKYNDLEGARMQFLVAARLAERSGENVAVIHQQLSTIAAQQGDFSRAIVFADNAVKFAPEVADYHYGLGQILLAYRRDILQEGIFEEDALSRQIERSFNTAIDLQPDTLPQLYLDGLTFYDLENPDFKGALILWNTLLNHPDSSPDQRDAIRVHQVRCLLKLKQPDSARSIVSLINDPDLRKSAQDLF